MEREALMDNISRREIKAKLAWDNPWWTEPEAVDGRTYADLPYRDFFEGFYQLSQLVAARRAVVLMGPRRAGKTVLLHQTIHKRLRSGVDGKRLMYVSIDEPLYTGMTLEGIVALLLEATGFSTTDEFSLFFDEIQSLKGWEAQLGALTEEYTNARCIAASSSTPHLRTGDAGAGLFAEFVLPPLTFNEFLRFSWNDYFPGKTSALKGQEVEVLNRAFLDYLNFGGFPEAAIRKEAKGDAVRFIQKGIVERTLLHNDAPSLFGVKDVQELNRLFAFIAYNTGSEFSYPLLSESFGIAKDTVKRYIEYLEAAFLIKKVSRIDESGKRFVRERSFKLHLVNPSMRAALFRPVSPEDDAVGGLVETAMHSQRFHTETMRHVRYARWQEGAVDAVALDPASGRPVEAATVAWSDSHVKNTEGIAQLIAFAKRHGIETVRATTRSVWAFKTIDGVGVQFSPSSADCFMLGRVNDAQRHDS